MERKEAIEVIKKNWPDSSFTMLRKALETLIPELKESEGERMVKFIKNQLFNIKKTITDNYELDTKLTKAIDWLEKRGEQKPTEDRYMEGYLNGINNASKTLKPAAWGEEDKEIIDYLIDYLESELDSSYTDLDKETFTKEINWLKSLKERCTYKPSKEQMKALYDSIPENVFEISEREQLLDSLYQDLKKL